MRAQLRRAAGSALLALCIVGLSRVVPSAVSPQVASLATGTSDIRGMLDAGRYVDAERLASQRVAGIQQAAGADSLESAAASDLLVEAQLRNGKGGVADTLAIADRIVQVKQRLLGHDALDLAVSLDNLGAIRTERGEMMAALPLHQRALAIRRTAFGDMDGRVADTLDRLALPLIRLQRFADAEKLLQESLRVREREPERSPLARASTLYLTSLLHRNDGRYALASELLEQSLAIRKQQLAADHPDVATTLQLRGELELLEGNLAAARTDWVAALAIEERTVRPDHPAVALTLRWLSGAARAYGDLSTARADLERALPIGEQWLGPCHQERPGLLNDFASIVQYEGNYAQAQKMFAEALAIRLRCLGPTDQRTATVIHNQALLAAEMGDFAWSEQLHRRAIRMWEIGLGPNHPFVARGLDALAEVMAARGQPTSALNLYERALAIRRRTLGSDHPDVAWTLTNIAALMRASGRVDVGLSRLNEAIDIYNRVGVGDEPDHFARALALRGTLETSRGDFEAARTSFGEAVTLRERIFGAAHPLVAEARAEVATADFALGVSDDALRAALDAEKIGRDQLHFTIRYLPERQALAYADKRPRGRDLALSIIAAGSGASNAAVFDAAIQSRAVVLDEIAARAQLAQSGDDELAALNATAATARERFANLMLQSLKGEDPVPRATLDEARDRKEAAERALAEKSLAARTEAARSNIGLQQIRDSLPSGSALVAFLRYDRTMIGQAAGKKTLRLVPSYIAFVIRSDTGTTDAVPLGSAAAIEATISAWRDEVGGQTIASGVPAAEAERMYRLAGARLRQRVWDPLTDRIRGASQVFIVPDGAINLVSFAAFPSGATRYLVEDGPVIHYLSTERDVVPTDATPAGHGLLAVGGPAFDERAVASPLAGARRSGCATLSYVHFEDLPGSRNEAADIAKIWPAGGPSADDAKVLSGRAATETSVKKAIVGRRVVHLATHGYFLDSRCDRAPANTRGVGALSSGSVPNAALAENPLLLTGLAFAGANLRMNARAGSDDGILSAEEVAGLNLQGVEWAVLSACDTAAGQIKAGEGVFGLRRAFQIAGARTIIMSLWSVEDLATRAWMRDLYDARFNKHLTTSAAVREASLSSIRGRRARHQSTHPFYWAAFVAAGDWR